MTARRCFTRKVAAGKVAARAGQQILTMLDDFEGQYRDSLGGDAAGRQAALDTAAALKAENARKADLVNRTITAQVTTLKRVTNYDDIVNGLRGTKSAPLALRKERTSTVLPALRAMLARDIHEIHGGFDNVFALAQKIRGEAHARMAAAIDLLRPKYAGTTVSKAAELEFLRAAYGRTDVPPEARLAYEGFNRAQDGLADQFIDAGGALVKRKDWRVPNPEIDQARVIALGPDRFRQLVIDNIDRDATIDWGTEKRMTDGRFEQMVADVFQDFAAGHVEGPPTGAIRGRPMLANQRDVPRVFVWKSAESWQAIAEGIGRHASPWAAAMEHVSGMSRDIALMRVTGPNPETWLRFASELINREATRLAQSGEAAGGDAKAVRANRKLGDQARRQARRLEDVFDEVTGRNRSPVNTALAAGLGDLRSGLVATQMGSALISSISDPVTLLMTARFNGLPVMRVLGRAVASLAQGKTEIHAAQLGLVADTLAHIAGQDDKIMGQTIRSSLAAKMGTAVIRASGLRLWTAKLRSAFSMEYMATLAREAETKFSDLPRDMREGFARYGLHETEWDLIRATEAFEPRPQALFLRPTDVAEGGTIAHRGAAEKLMRLINTEMDYAVIEQDPIARARLLGDTKAGTGFGEVRRAMTMYRSFSASFVSLHFARAFARGFNGRRLTHGAMTLLFMTAMGALANQLKQLKAGRDPFTLDPTTGFGVRAWGAALLQGGGLGVFGDLVGGATATRNGNTIGPLLGGPIIAAGEDVKNFVFGNLQKAANGEETHFLGDALYLAGKYTPGHNLWYGQLAFQREILDQLALMLDPKAGARFARMERDAARTYGQEYWWAPGETAPERAPNLGIGSPP